MEPHKVACGLSQATLFLDVRGRGAQMLSSPRRRPRCMTESGLTSSPFFFQIDANFNV